MLIATVPYVGKRLHLDPDPKLNYGFEHANNFGSGRIRIHNPAFNFKFPIIFYLFSFFLHILLFFLFSLLIFFHISQHFLKYTPPEVNVCKRWRKREKGNKTSKYVLESKYLNLEHHCCQVSKLKEIYLHSEHYCKSQLPMAIIF